MFFSQGGSSLEEQPGGAGRLLSCSAFSLRLGLARYAAAGTPTCPGAHYKYFINNDYGPWLTKRWFK